MQTIIDIRYITKTIRGLHHINLIRHFEGSTSYLCDLERLLLRDDIIKITIEKYEVDN